MSGAGAGRPGRRERGSAAPALLLVLGLAGAAAGLETWARSVPRAVAPGGSIIYVPSGKYLHYAALGYDGLAADAVYLWAIQYFGDSRIPDRFAGFEHVFTIISDLDPRYVDPYDIGALIAVYDMRNPALGLRILDRGFARNPGQWFFPFQAGHIAQMMLKDWELARSYYRKAMDVPGSPAILKRLYAQAAYRGGDLRTAWEDWREVFDTTTDPQVKGFASNHLYRIKADLDALALRGPLDAYRARAGRWPRDLDALRAAGLVREVPRDMDGRPYVYDPATGTISTAVNPWKR